MHAFDLTGQSFNRWTVVSRGPNTRQGQARWQCRCECGTERLLKSILIRRGISKSCGCLNLEVLASRSTKHGHATNGISPTYHSWSGMMARCSDKKHSHFRRYGGRGVTICDRWQTFANFLADMGEKPKGTSLDRIDVDGNYEPGNCRWATPKQQARNKSSNRLITVEGETRCVAEWTEIKGYQRWLIPERLERGWDDVTAVTTPPETKFLSASRRCQTST